eukprot:scaffold29615_cov81-Isochrysis_galbana.AAC.2
MASHRATTRCRADGTAPRIDSDGAPGTTPSISGPRAKSGSFWSLSVKIKTTAASWRARDGAMSEGELEAAPEPRLDGGASSADAADALCALGSVTPNDSEDSPHPREQSRASPSEVTAAAAATVAAGGSAIAAAAPLAARLGQAVPDTEPHSVLLAAAGSLSPGTPPFGPEPKPTAKRQKSSRSQPKQGWTRLEDETILNTVQQFGTK